MAKQNKKKQERKLAAREKHKNNSKSQENDSTDDPDLEKQLDRINLKLSYGFYELLTLIGNEYLFIFYEISGLELAVDGISGKKHPHLDEFSSNTVWLMPRN